MKRLLIFLLFFLFITPVFAESKPIFNPKILEAPGPIPGPKTIVPQVASKAPWSYAVNLARQAYQLITGEEGTTQQESFVIKTPNNRTDGEDIENAAVWLTPKFLQDNYLKLVTYSQHMTANHVNCFYDEDGGSDHRPDEKIFHPPAIGWNRIRPVIVLASYMTPFTLPLTGLNLFMEEVDEKVLPDNGKPCGTQTDNSKHIDLFEDGDNEQIYTEGDNMQWTASEFCPDLLEKYLTCLWNNATNPPDEEDEPCSLICSGGAETIYSTNLPAAKTKVNPRTGRIEDNVCTGYTCSYLAKDVNDSERLKFTHGENVQDHEIHLGILNANTTSEQAVYYGEYSRRQAMIAKRCSNMAKDAPGYDEAECTFPVAKPTITACNTTELPDLSGANGSCSLCGTSLPKTMVDIFNKAASTYSVPASILYSVFESEGGLNRWSWSEDLAIEASVCGGEVPDCDANASGTGARGPFGFLSTGSSGNYQWSPDYYQSSKSVDPNRNVFSPCNLLDSAFAAAAKLAKESGGSGKYPAPASCWGHPFYSSAVGPPSSCNWEPERISTAIRQYTGYCTEQAYVGPGGSSGAQTVDNNHWKRAYDFYGSYSCQ